MIVMSKAILPIGIAALILLAVYGVAYWLLVVNTFEVIDTYRTQHGTAHVYRDHYPYGGHAAERLFAPANKVDRFIRPDWWNSEPSYCPVGLE
jgi:hypothetical protein